jgi:sortase B
MSKISKVLAIIITIVSLSGLGYSSYVLYSYFHEINEAEDSFSEVKELIIDEPVVYIDDSGNLVEPEEILNVDTNQVNAYTELAETNPDFVGWITIPGTNIDYPVVQTPDNEQYYIYRDFYGDYSSSGCLFCSANSDVVTPSMNTVIYGHHMIAGTMFAQLDDYRNEDFYSTHKYIQFNTLNRYATYEVIAAFETDLHATTYKYYEFVNGTEEEFNEFIENTKGRTSYTTADVDYGDEFITLSTCSYHTSNGRFVVVAKRVI